MTVRQDKFKTGDKVTWVNDHYANLTDGRKMHGDGPFEIIGVHPVNSSAYRSAGHTQHLVIAISEPDLETQFDRYSGAFFKKVD